MSEHYQHFFILKDGQPVPADSKYDFMRWMHDHYFDSIVGKSTIGEMVISTLYIGTDYNDFRKPLLWQTYIWGGPFDDGQSRRYPTLAEAERGHQMAIEECQDLLTWML